MTGILKILIEVFDEPSIQRRLYGCGLDFYVDRKTLQEELHTAIAENRARSNWLVKSMAVDRPRAIASWNRKLEDIKQGLE